MTVRLAFIPEMGVDVDGAEPSVDVRMQDVLDEEGTRALIVELIQETASEDKNFEKTLDHQKNKQGDPWTDELAQVHEETRRELLTRVALRHFNLTPAEWRDRRGPIEDNITKEALTNLKRDYIEPVLDELTSVCGVEAVVNKFKKAAAGQLETTGRHIYALLTTAADRCAAEGPIANPGQVANEQFDGVSSRAVASLIALTEAQGRSMAFEKGSNIVGNSKEVNDAVAAWKAVDVITIPMDHDCGNHCLGALGAAARDPSAVITINKEKVLEVRSLILYEAHQLWVQDAGKFINTFNMEWEEYKEKQVAPASTLNWLSNVETMMFTQAEENRTLEVQTLWIDDKGEQHMYTTLPEGTTRDWVGFMVFNPRGGHYNLGGISTGAPKDGGETRYIFRRGEADMVRNLLTKMMLDIRTLCQHPSLQHAQQQHRCKQGSSSPRRIS